MATRRISSSNYLGVGLAIATGAAVNLTSWSQAQAQDLNLQTQMNITAPPPVVAPPTADVLSKDVNTWKYLTWKSSPNKGTCSPVDSAEVREFALQTDNFQRQILSIKAKALSSGIKGAPPAKTESVLQDNMSDAEKMEFLRQRQNKGNSSSDRCCSQYSGQ